MEWIKKEPVAFLLGLLVLGIAAREYFREPVPATAPVPQRLIIETSGGEAVTAADGTITVKVETPDQAPEEKSAVPVAVAAQEPKPNIAVPEVVAAPAVPEKETVVVPEPQVVKTDEKSVAEESSNTAGGLGEAAVREKSTSEEVVPEEARKLAESVGRKISPILQSLRKSGRLNWKLGELEDDVLILDWKQEQFLIQLSYALQAYIMAVDNFRSAVEDRKGMVEASAVYTYLLERISEGRIVHPKLRLALGQGLFSSGLSPINSFCDAENLDDGNHPLSAIRVRLVTFNMRRSDLFYMLAVYRLITEDYARLLQFEGQFDRVMATLQIQELYEDSRYSTTVVPNGGIEKDETVRLRAVVFLPRKHRPSFNQMFSGEEPTGFLTTNVTPLERDDLKETRSGLAPHIDTLIELLGSKWAEFDFEKTEINGEDTYFTERILLEELETRTALGDLHAFRDYVNRMKQAGNVADAVKVAREMLDEEEAKHLGGYVTRTPESMYASSLNGPDDKFKVEDMTQSLRGLYAKMSGQGLRKLLSEPPPEDLQEATKLLSEGYHVLARGDKDAALAKFKAAKAKTKLSDMRKKSLAEFCRANGFVNDASTFWTEPPATDGK